MAHIEIHALSVKLAGTFEAHVFFPEQEVEKAEEKFPVLWMIHEDGTGTFDLMRHAALMEKIAEEKKMFVIAPMISHSLATNMAFGTKNEEFLVEECPEIFRLLYPVSEKKEDNYIFGIHTGAYGAVKLAMKHPDVYAGCFAVNGELDIAGRCKDSKNREAGFRHQSEESLKAVFGDLDRVSGGQEDIYHLAGNAKIRIELFCSTKLDRYKDNKRLEEADTFVTLTGVDKTEDFQQIEEMIQAGADKIIR